MPYKDPEKKKEAHKRYSKSNYLKYKEFRKQQIKDRQVALRDWVFELRRSKPCVYCGEAHPACIDFHHRDATEKLLEVATMVRDGYSKERILAEIEKCDAVCANCHRKLHYELREN